MIRALSALAALALAPAAQAAVPDVQSHRGGPVLAGVPTFPEETMPVFRNTAERLGTVLELDTKLTADGVPVVIHDATLERTTPCEGLVADRTLAQLAECPSDVLGAPNNDLEWVEGIAETVPIPTLAEVLAYARDVGIGVNLEIKNYPTDPDWDGTPAFANRVMDVVLESGIPADRVIMQSFTPDNLMVAEQRMPGAEIALLALSGFEDAALEGAASRGWDWVSPSWPVDRAYVDEAHSRGLRVVPYTLNKPDAVTAAADAGVDALITDDPLMALQTLDPDPPGVKLRPLTRKLAKVRRKRRLGVRVTTDEPATVRLTVRLRRKRVGRAETAFDDAGAQRVVVRLERRVKRALRGRDRANLKLVARSTDRALNTGTTRAVAKLR